MKKLKGRNELTLKDKIDKYTSLLHVIEDCIVIIQKEKSEEIKKSEASGTLYNLLIGYVGSIKSLSILERCLLKAFAYAENIPLAQVFTKQKLRASQRPQIVMKLFDKALKSLKNLSQERGIMDPVKLSEYSLKEMIIQVYLKFYIAVFYANEKRFDAAYWILKRAKDEVKRCKEYCQNSVSIHFLMFLGERRTKESWKLRNQSNRIYALQDKGNAHDGVQIRLREYEWRIYENGCKWSQA